LYAPPPGAISEPAAVALASGYAVFVMAEKELVNTSYFRRIYKKISLDGGATWSNWEPIMYQYDTAVSNPEAWGPSNGYNYTVAAPTTNNGHGLLNFCWGQVP
jgi:Neuraminidase (sialidase)